MVEYDTCIDPIAHGCGLEQEWEREVKREMKEMRENPPPKDGAELYCMECGHGNEHKEWSLPTIPVRKIVRGFVKIILSILYLLITIPSTIILLGVMFVAWIYENERWMNLPFYLITMNRDEVDDMTYDSMEWIIVAVGTLFGWMLILSALGIVD